MAKGLVLAGGGAKGSYQIGVWKALTELNWMPEIITGTSIGSLNGALLAQGDYETARAMWLTLHEEDILSLPADNTLPEISAFVKDAIRSGGMDVEPLEKMVMHFVDENKLRHGKVKFGLVTVEQKKLKVCELALDEIPEGRLAEYLLASAACFPALRPRIIDGKKFIDGGYRDNMPFNLAKRMGATELVTVDINGIGITKPNLTGLPTVAVHCYWELGDLFAVNREQAQRNMELGYNDTFRAFGKLRGTAYAIRPEHAREQLAALRKPFNACMRRLADETLALELTGKAALTLFRAEDKPLAFLECAAKAAEVDPTPIYTVEELAKAFLKAYDPEKFRRLDGLFDPDGPDGLDILRGITDPQELVAAVAYRAWAPQFAPDQWDVLDEANDPDPWWELFANDEKENRKAISAQSALRLPENESTKP